MAIPPLRSHHESICVDSFLVLRYFTTFPRWEKRKTKNRKKGKNTYEPTLNKHAHSSPCGCFFTRRARSLWRQNVCCRGLLYCDAFRGLVDKYGYRQGNPCKGEIPKETTHGERVPHRPFGESICRNLKIMRGEGIAVRWGSGQHKTNADRTAGLAANRRHVNYIRIYFQSQP